VSDLNADIVAVWRLGFIGQEIAEVSGMTRNAVLGRLFRAGALGGMERAERGRRIAAGQPPTRQLRRRPGLANGVLSFGA
jgi:hypothetical protein